MKAPIVVVGVGALGSHFVQAVRGFQEPLKVIDFDVVEAKNLRSQFHGKSGVRQLKVTALRGLMDFLWGVKIEGVPHKLTLDNPTQLLGDAKLVVDCLDNGESRRIVQRFVREHSIPCLHGGVSGDGSYGRIVWDEIFEADDAPPGAPTCENGDHLPFLMYVAATMAMTTQHFLTSGTKISLEATPQSLLRL